MQKPHQLIAALLLGFVVAGSTGCSVAGQPHAPSAVVSSYLAEQAVANRHANAVVSCASMLSSMAGTTRAYNTMIEALNSSHDMAALRGVDRTVIGELDRDKQEFVSARGRDLPPELRAQVDRTAQSADVVRKVVAGKQRDGLNSAAQGWDAARKELVRVCRKYLPR